MSKGKSQHGEKCTGVLTSDWSEKEERNTVALKTRECEGAQCQEENACIPHGSARERRLECSVAGSSRPQSTNSLIGG